MNAMKERILALQQRIREAERESGREPGSVTLVAASKMNDAAAVRTAFEAGIRVFGENRVQELVEKREQGAGILLVSSELTEIMSLSDRIYVIHNGRINGEFTRSPELGEEDLIAKMV